MPARDRIRTVQYFGPTTTKKRLARDSVHNDFLSYEEGGRVVTGYFFKSSYATLSFREGEFYYSLARRAKTRRTAYCLQVSEAVTYWHGTRTDRSTHEPDFILISESASAMLFFIIRSTSQPLRHGMTAAGAAPARLPSQRDPEEALTRRNVGLGAVSGVLIHPPLLALLSAQQPCTPTLSPGSIAVSSPLSPV